MPIIIFNTPIEPYWVVVYEHYGVISGGMAATCWVVLPPSGLPKFGDDVGTLGF